MSFDHAAFGAHSLVREEIMEVVGGRGKYWLLLPTKVFIYTSIKKNK